jgi:DNA sulfur modification protein DndC
MGTRQPSLFEGARMTLEDSISLSLSSLQAYGERYRHWALAYSGGKDSSVTVTFVAWAILNKLVPVPESLTVLYADTRMELPPLQRTAMILLAILAGQGFQTRVVLPALDQRFYVYMLGRGVPPPKNRFRWCTPQLKIEPMMYALRGLRQAAGEKMLMLTGVRLGESAARDQRIAISCSRDSGECGQGWFQIATPEAVADTLAPLLHWRLCHVYDWLYFEQDRHGYDVNAIAAIYGDGDVRTGCVGCNLASRDVSLERLIKVSEWSHLRPLLELKPLYRELKKAKWRKRKALPEVRKDGTYSKNVQRMGPLTMEARAYGLERVLDIQTRARVDLINPEEEARIREMWALDVWPERWSSRDVDGLIPLDALSLDERGQLVTQALLVR